MIHFTLDGDPFDLSREKVEAALKNQTPGRVQVYAVEVHQTHFPVKQALASALQISGNRFTSARAVELLTKVGLHVIDTELRSAGRAVAEDGGATFDRRSRALELAVNLYSSSAEPDPDVVLRAAHTFDDWLSPGVAGI